MPPRRPDPPEARAALSRASEAWNLSSMRGELIDRYGGDEDRARRYWLGFAGVSQADEHEDDTPGPPAAASIGATPPPGSPFDGG